MRDCIIKNKAIYLPIKVKTATPSARMPMMTLGIDMNIERPKKRKNNKVHQPAMELGIVISHSPIEL